MRTRGKDFPENWFRGFRGSVARHLGRLVRAVVLRVAALAVKGKRRASEYVYEGPTFATVAEAS
jgi:hypothetical protein